LPNHGKSNNFEKSRYSQLPEPILLLLSSLPKGKKFCTSGIDFIQNQGANFRSIRQKIAPFAEIL